MRCQPQHCLPAAVAGCKAPRATHTSSWKEAPTRRWLQRGAEGLLEQGERGAGGVQLEAVEPRVGHQHLQLRQRQGCKAIQKQALPTAASGDVLLVSASSAHSNCLASLPYSPPTSTAPRSIQPPTAAALAASAPAPPAAAPAGHATQTVMGRGGDRAGKSVGLGASSEPCMYHHPCCNSLHVTNIQTAQCSQLTSAVKEKRPSSEGGRLAGRCGLDAT